MAEQQESPFLPALDFGPADLAANRRGELSIDQQLRLEELADRRRGWARRNTPWVALGVVVLLVVGVVLEADNDEPGARFAMASFVGLCLFFGAAVYASHRATLARPRDISSVHAAEGVADPKTVRRRSRAGWYHIYELHLRGGHGRTPFRFADQETLDRFRAGERYRVYWVPERPWPIVLSVEPVTDGGGAPWGGPVGGR